MKNNTPERASHLLTDKKNYLIKFGGFMRKYSLDELAQIFNIIKGDLNFIGPRPGLYNQYNLISGRKIKNIDNIKPGITGWAQVNGRDNISTKEKIHLDFFYLKNQSFLLDIKILFITIIKAFKAKNAS